MLTLNSILKEMKDVPVNRLEELYQFINSLNQKVKQTETARKKILSYAGIFKEMSDKDYKDFLSHTKKTRTKLFDRDLNLCPPPL
jgi:hypothetical protein